MLIVVGTHLYLVVVGDSSISTHYGIDSPTLASQCFINVCAMPVTDSRVGSARLLLERTVLAGRRRPAPPRAPARRGRVLCRSARRAAEPGAYNAKQTFFARRESINF